MEEKTFEKIMILGMLEVYDGRVAKNSLESVAKNLQQCVGLWQAGLSNREGY